MTVPVETLVASKRRAGEATPDLVLLRGARIAFATESDQTAKLGGGTMKRLASIDRMTGRQMYGTTQTWDPTHTLHLSTNHLPAVDDATEGFWRRIALVPWSKHFRQPGAAGDGPQADTELLAKLDAELSGIVAWAIRGATASVFPLPDAVRARTDAYREEEDRLASFVAERIVYSKGATVTAGDLFTAYRDWCEAQELAPYERLGRRNLWRAFEERGGAPRKKGARTAYFDGARLLMPFEARTGLRLIAQGSVDVFEPQGAYQLYVKSLMPSGHGDLALRFEALKAKLAAEGLFDAAKKRSLPPMPLAIGVVTSLSGAVLHDIRRVLARRWPMARVVVSACQVQGQGAAQTIVAALRRISRWTDEETGRATDVVILARGGGSLEDL